MMMAQVIFLMKGAGRCLTVSLAGLVLLGFSGCAGEPAKSAAPPVTPDQVRSHAEKAFGNLKQEEQQRAADPGNTSY